MVGAGNLLHRYYILAFTLLSAISFAQEMPASAGQSPETKAPASKLLVCSGSNGTVIIDTSGENPIINIPSTLWPKKGNGWYQVVGVTDEPTVVRGKIDLGAAKAPFSIDKYTLRLTIDKSEGWIPLGRPLNLIANCIRQ